MGRVLKKVISEEKTMIEGVEATRITYRSFFRTRELNVIETYGSLAQESIVRYYRKRCTGRGNFTFVDVREVMDSYEEAHKLMLVAMNRFKHNFIIKIRFKEEGDVLKNYIVFDGITRKEFLKETREKSSAA